MNQTSDSEALTKINAEVGCLKVQRLFPLNFYKDFHSFSFNYLSILSLLHASYGT